ncbi:MAG: F0F1 ATP synthase subunit A [Blastocatellia bacterium]
MAILAFIQEPGAHGAPAAETAGHGAAAVAEHGAEAAAHSGPHMPVLVEWVNHLLGDAAFQLQSQLMPPLYNLFGAHWPGEGKTLEAYMHEGHLPIPTHVVMFGLVTLFTVLVLWFLRGKLSAESPSNRQQTFEVGVETIRSMLADLVGPHGVKHFPVVATFATLILFSNLLGLVPDMVSPTANLNVTLALALTSFVYYNAVGIMENGLLGHLKHFCGPVIWLAWLMFPIEIISNFARILSLSMRLFGNIYGEEQVSGVVGSMMPWIVPMLLYPLSLLAAFLQAFIFVLLSMIYLGEVSHHGGDHQEDHAHGHTEGHKEHAAAH